MPTSYQFQMYAVRQIHVDVLRSFSLPADPYFEPTDGSENNAIAELQRLGVVFYRDEFNSEGILIQPNDGDPTPLAERRGFRCWRYSGLLETDERTYLRIAPWSKASKTIIQKYGDDRAWTVRGSLHNVESMEPTRVALS
jgi:hypothetical protein